MGGRRGVLICEERGSVGNLRGSGEGAEVKVRGLGRWREVKVRAYLRGQEKARSLRPEPRPW